MLLDTELENNGITLLKLYNTLTRKLEIFKPLEKEKIKMVTCGPSIYQTPHIGNYRTFVFEDTLQRYQPGIYIPKLLLNAQPGSMNIMPGILLLQ